MSFAAASAKFSISDMVGFLCCCLGLFFEVFVEFECSDDECGDWCHACLLCLLLFAFVNVVDELGCCGDEDCDWVHDCSFF